MPRMIVDSVTGKVKRKPTTNEAALARGGESVWGEGLVAKITAHGLSRGRSGSKLSWYNPGLQRTGTTPAAGKGA